MRTLVVVILAALLAGCAQTLKEYPGAEKKPSELVRVTSHSSVFLASVNGTKREPPLLKGPLLYGGFELLLEPGEHELGVWWGAGGPVSMYTPTTYLRFHGAAGSAFEVTATHTGYRTVQLGIRKVEGKNAIP